MWEESGTEVVFVPSGDRELEVVDPIERRRLRLRSADRIAPSEGDPEAFRFPVDAATAVETERVDFPGVYATYVRDPEGGMLAEVEPGEDERLDGGRYLLEVCAPTKLYLVAEGPLTVSATGGRLSVGFERPRPVQVGARSRHERPAGTVTTTTDPEDLMAAVSTFGSALKTTSPERSFPTLRGHPPTLELGDDLSVPEGLDPPVDDVRIEVPPAHEYVFPVAPLAFYLGVRVVPGPTPRIVGDGIDHLLDGEFERAVRRTLERTFFLDCVTRTEGLYRVDLHERRAVESAVGVDFGALYDAPPAERLATHLSIPYETVAPYAPEWPTTARVQPGPEAVEPLPFLVDDLAAIRTTQPESIDPSAVASGTLHGLVRGSAATSSGESYVRTGAGDGAAATWVGEGMPVDANKAVTQAYRNRIGRTPDAESIDIAVVCNDPAMDGERDAVDDVYGSRSDLAFDVTLHRDLPTDRLRALLADDYDLVHYIGHIEDGGFRCPDGRLDAGSIDDVGVDAFVLNACTSYRQGLSLVEAGAIGGIVTLSDVVNLGAVRIGGSVAELLDAGFPLRAALAVARDESLIGVEYSVVGDGSLRVAQPESGVTQLYRLTERGDGFDLEIETFAAGDHGGMFYPHLPSNDRHHLLSGEFMAFSPTRAELEEFLLLESVPVRYDGDLYWSEEFVRDVLRDRA